MMPLLTAFSSLMGIMGGYAMAVGYYRMPSNSFLDPLPIHVTTFDVVSGLIKSVAFGIIIVTISCYKGMTTRGGAAGVGRSPPIVWSYAIPSF